MINHKNTFVISHPTKKDERKLIFDNQIQVKGFTVTYYDPVDATAFKDINNNLIPLNAMLMQEQTILYKDHAFKYTPHTNSKVNNRTSTTNYIATTLSHFFLYKKLLEDDSNDYYLIFEDDFRLTKDFDIQYLHSCIEELPKDFDVCMFSPRHAHRVLHPISTPYSNNLYRIKEDFNLYSGVSMYLVSKQYAKKVISRYGFNYVYVSDDHLSNFSLEGNLKAYATFKIFGFGNVDAFPDAVQQFNLL